MRYHVRITLVNIEEMASVYLWQQLEPLYREEQLKETRW